MHSKGSNRKNSGSSWNNDSELKRLSESIDGKSFNEYSEDEIRWEIIDDEAISDTDERAKTVKLVSALTIALSFAICVALTVAAISSSYGIPDVIPSDNSNEKEEQKVIYIRDETNESGILTAPEIYTKGLPSSVTVIDLDRKTSGSGFVYREDGYVATAAHVVDIDSSIEIVMSNGKRFEASVVASDALCDIALLKINAEDLRAVEFGRSGELIVGERVHVIGSPLSEQYSGTFSSGEITYTNRKIEVLNTVSDELEKRLTVFQTNVDLSEGNSGSPIFDEYGRLVGMVTMRLGGKYNGVGFAIPSDGMDQILRAMIEGRKLNSTIISAVAVPAPTLGIEGESVSVGGVYGYEIKNFKESDSNSRLVLKIGDVITRIGDKAVYSRTSALEAIKKYSPTDKVQVGVLRNGQELTFEVRLGNY